MNRGTQALESGTPKRPAPTEQTATTKRQKVESAGASASAAGVSRAFYTYLKYEHAREYKFSRCITKVWAKLTKKRGTFSLVNSNITLLNELKPSLIEGHLLINANEKEAKEYPKTHDPEQMKTKEAQKFYLILNHIKRNILEEYMKLNITKETQATSKVSLQLLTDMLYIISKLSYDHYLILKDFVLNTYEEAKKILKDHTNNIPLNAAFTAATKNLRLIQKERETVSATGASGGGASVSRAGQTATFSGGGKCAATMVPTASLPEARAESLLLSPDEIKTVTTALEASRTHHSFKALLEFFVLCPIQTYTDYQLFTNKDVLKHFTWSKQFKEEGKFRQFFSKNIKCLNIETELEERIMALVIDGGNRTVKSKLCDSNEKKDDNCIINSSGDKLYLRLMNSNGATYINLIKHSNGNQFCTLRTDRHGNTYKNWNKVNKTQSCDVFILTNRDKYENWKMDSDGNESCTLRTDPNGDKYENWKMDSDGNEFCTLRTDDNGNKYQTWKKVNKTQSCDVFILTNRDKYENWKMDSDGNESCTLRTDPDGNTIKNWKKNKETQAKPLPAA
jgi:hypothetical protein